MNISFIYDPAFQYTITPIPSNGTSSESSSSVKENDSSSEVIPQITVEETITPEERKERTARAIKKIRSAIWNLRKKELKLLNPADGKFLERLQALHVERNGGFRESKYQELKELRAIRLELTEELIKHQNEKYELEYPCRKIMAIWASSKEEELKLAKQALAPYQKKIEQFLVLLKYVNNKIAQLSMILWPYSPAILQQEKLLRIKLTETSEKQLILPTPYSRIKPGVNQVYQFDNFFFKEGPNLAVEAMLREIFMLYDEDKASLPTLPIIVNSSNEVWKTGIVQLEQEGQTLGQLLAHSSSKIYKFLSRELVIKNFIITIIMGMFDAHGGNIKVSKDKQLVFFDLSLSAPPSNIILDWHGILRLPFRSALMSFPCAYSPLTDAEKENIKNYVQKYTDTEKQKRLTDIIFRYKLSMENGTEMIKSDIAKAFDERVEAMLSVFDDPNVKSLRDIAAVVFPAFRLFSALATFNYAYHHPASFLSSMKKENSIEAMQALVGTQVGYRGLEELLENLNRITPQDPIKLYNSCLGYENFDVVLEEIKNFLIQDLQAVPKNIYTDIVLQKQNLAEVVKVTKQRFEAIANYLQRSPSKENKKASQAVIASLKKVSKKESRQ